mmetsp:Transcript_30500/g.78307  ORF Transcript_30500/g.78307 Transcript_30500/m.78307 type:complete len:216 (-) Transcript_30500:215-862(-)
MTLVAHTRHQPRREEGNQTPPAHDHVRRVHRDLRLLPVGVPVAFASLDARVDAEVQVLAARRPHDRRSCQAVREREVVVVPRGESGSAHRPANARPEVLRPDAGLGAAQVGHVRVAAVVDLEDTQRHTVGHVHWQRQVAALAIARVAVLGGSVEVVEEDGDGLPVGRDDHLDCALRAAAAAEGDLASVDGEGRTDGLDDCIPCFVNGVHLELGPV